MCGAAVLAMFSAPGGAGGRSDRTGLVRPAPTARRTGLQARRVVVGRQLVGRRLPFWLCGLARFPVGVAASALGWPALQPLRRRRVALVGRLLVMWACSVPWGSRPRQTAAPGPSRPVASPWSPYYVGLLGSRWGSRLGWPAHPSPMGNSRSSRVSLRWEPDNDHPQLLFHTMHATCGRPKVVSRAYYGWQSLLPAGSSPRQLRRRGGAGGREPISSRRKCRRVGDPRGAIPFSKRRPRHRLAERLGLRRWRCSGDNLHYFDYLGRSVRSRPGDC